MTASKREIPIETIEQSDPNLLAGLHLAFAEEPWDASAMARLLGLPETIAYIAARAAEPCGLVLARRTGNDCEILTIGVTPPMRGMGIGTALLRAACEWGSGIGGHRMVLEVDGGNRPALRLYEKFGFENCGRRPAYYAGAPRRDALILQMPLTGGLAIGEPRHI